MEPAKEEASVQLKGIWAMGGKKAYGCPLAHEESSMGLVDLKAHKVHRGPISSLEGLVVP